MRPSRRRPTPASRLALAGGLALVVGCGGPIELSFMGTSRAPGLDGRVKIERLDGGNAWITFDVTNAPPPPRFGAGLTTLVVWVEGPEPPPVRAGALDYDARARQGFLQFTTPFDRFVLRLTAEPGPTVSRPSGPVLAEQRVSIE